jgi:outer membrane protein OmpA-like peptidoglycan-associated protein
MKRYTLLLAVVAGLCTAFSPAVSHADPGRLNLRIEAGVGLPTAGYLAPRGENDGSANLAISGFVSLDYVIGGPLALEIIGGVGGLAELAKDPIRDGSLTASGGLGVRLRLLESRALSLATHLGIYRFDGLQFGGDASLGYDFALSHTTSLGLFVRYQITAKGDGPWTEPNDAHFDSALYAGLGLQFGLVHDDEEEVVPEPEPVPEDTDDDDDGIANDVDACRAQAEDMDGFEDTDGCPDLDDDDDGVPDASDGAPREPEDRDGFEDQNGVPDPDNDADGFPDASDRCPNEAGVAVMNGCPDPDRDADTVVDRLDNCPDEAGTVENHGCQARQLVVIEGDRLIITDTVYFRSARNAIDRRSFPLLDNIARVVASHPEITRVRVEGHTDARGNHDRNVALSQARAEAVVAYLVSKGVEASRLVANGFGPDRPVVPNARTRAEHGQNRRVEFHIETANSPAPATTPAPAPASVPPTP